MPVKVVIIVEGGNVQHCYAEAHDVEVEIIDFDNLQEEGRNAVQQADDHVRETVGVMHQVC